MKKGRLIRNIIPDDEAKFKNPRYYPAGAIVDITESGFYVFNGGPLAGWIFKNIKTRELKVLQEGVDYEMI